MKPAIISYRALPADVEQYLDQQFSVTRFDGLSEQNFPDFINALPQAEGLIGFGGKIDKTVLERAPRLRAVSTVSVGYDNFDVAEMTRRGILMMHTPTELTETVADTAISLMLASARRIVELSQWIKEGRWTAAVADEQYGYDVHHKTLGIIGMGRIGAAIAQRAHFGFSMPVLYNSRSRHYDAEQRFNAQYRNLDALLAESDFVCIVLPHTEETIGMIGRQQLAMMKSSAILINVGRGTVIDENALIEALQNKTILAAGLDVFEHEPLQMDSPLLNLPNAVLVPHIGSATHETRYNMARTAVKNLAAALERNISKNCVNPEALK